MGGEKDGRRDPGGRDRAQDVAVRECDGATFSSVPDDELDELEGSRVDLRRGLAAGAAVAVDLPSRVHLEDLLGGQAFVPAVVELFQQRRDPWVVEARQLGRAQGSLHRARVDRGELDALQAATQVARVLLAARRQRKVGVAGVLPGEAPLGFAVAGEIEVEAQAGLPINSGRPERRERLALSITAPARTR